MRESHLFDPFNVLQILAIPFPPILLPFRKNACGAWLANNIYFNFKLYRRQVTKSVLNGLSKIYLKDAVSTCKIKVTLADMILWLRVDQLVFPFTGHWKMQYSHYQFRALLFTDKVVDHTFIYAIFKLMPLYARVSWYVKINIACFEAIGKGCLLYTSPSPRD